MAVQEKKLTIGKNKILMADEEDGELASEAVENREAFAELYRRHVDRVYRYFMFKVGNSLDAQELTSQTFLAALENIAHYRGEGSFLGWLFGIANRKAAQFYGKINSSLVNWEQIFTIAYHH